MRRLVLFFACLQPAAYGMDPVVDYQLHFKQGSVFAVPGQTIKEEQGAVIVRDDTAILGSAVRVCVDDRPERDWFISAAHVVERTMKPTSQHGMPLRVEFIHSASDLAILSAPKSNLPCTRVARYLVAALVYDVAANSLAAVSYLELEAYDRKEQRLQRKSFYSAPGFSVGKGLPGRDEAGKLLLVNANGYRGMSGGGLWASVSQRAGIEGSLEWNAPKNRSDLVLAGMILAVDEEDRKIAALPGPRISQIMQDFFSGQKEPQVNERSVPGGTEYLDLGAVHFRSTRAVEAGTGGLSDGGTGALGDGTSKLQTGKFRSGIVFRADPSRRWISIDATEQWTETEALPLEVRAALNRGDWQGIYEQRGKLYATSRMASPPQWMEIPKSTSWRHSDDCVITNAVFSESATPVGVAAKVIICESGDNYTRRLRITVLGSSEPALDGLAIKIDLSKDCPYSGWGRCPITMKGYFTQSASLSRLGAGAAREMMEGSKKFFANWSSRPNQALNSDGLRQFSAGDLTLQLERHGGYELKFTKNGKHYRLTGPDHLELREAEVYHPVADDSKTAKAKSAR